MAEQDANRKSSAGSRGKKSPVKKPSPYTQEQRAKAEEISDRSGIPLAMALQVVSGSLDLNDALKRLMRKEKAQKLAAREHITLQEALHVLDGKLSLDQALLIRELKQSPARQADRSVLEDLATSRAPAIFHRFGQEPLQAQVAGIEKYDCTLEDASGERQSFPKHELKLVAPPAGADAPRADQEGAAGPRFSRDPEVAALDLGPSVRYTDRFRSSKRVLFRAYRDRVPVRVTFRDGEQVRGHVGWHSRYEFQLMGAPASEEDLKRPLGPGQVVVFRHAMHRLEELEPSAAGTAPEETRSPELEPRERPPGPGNKAKAKASKAKPGKAKPGKAKPKKKGKPKSKKKR